MKKKKVILSSILSLALCLSLIVGGTFALFTSESKTNVAITSGKVEVVATIENLAVHSPTAIAEDGTIVDDTNAAANGVFANGGTATIEDATLTLDKMTPGDEVTFDIRIENNSTVAVQYRTLLAVSENNGLFEGLNVTVGDVPFVTDKRQTPWTSLAVGSEDIIVSVEVLLPSTAGNEYQEKSAKLSFTVSAVQGNTDTSDINSEEDALLYDGANTVNIPAGTLPRGQVAKLNIDKTATAPAAVATLDNTVISAMDISIVDADGNPIDMPTANYTVTMDIGKGLDATKLAIYHNDQKVEPISYNAGTGIVTFTTTSFSPFVAVLEGVGTIDSAEDLIALSNAVNAGDNKEGIIYNLAADIDLTDVEWTAIGATAVNSPAVAFAGTFDGQGHTISNLKDAALFGTVHGTVKNLKLEDVSANAPIGGFLVATLGGKLEGCSVKNATVTSTTTGSSGMVGFAGIGAVIDKCSVDGYTLTVTNTEDNRDKVGGLVGQASGATITNSSVSNITLNGVYKTKEWGGFVGRHANYGTIENCTATNVKINVSGYAQSVGGFVGAPANATIKNCDVNGVTIKVNNCGWVGGFAGYIGDAETYNFDNCNVTGMSITLETDSVSGIGGFCGRAAYTLTIKNCSVEGTIDATATAIATGKIKALVGYDRVEQFPDIMVTENNTTDVTINTIETIE